MVVVLLVRPLATADLFDSIAISATPRPCGLVRAFEPEVTAAVVAVTAVTTLFGWALYW